MYNEKELGDIITVDYMKGSIKKLGQSRTLKIINTAICEEQRGVYKQIFFQAVHKLEV